MTSDLDTDGAGRGESAVLRPDRLDGAIFAPEGVLTDTAATHFRAWEVTLDAFLRGRAEEEGTPFEPFNRNDCRRHVEGEPRYEGALDFLRARGIELPFGGPGDPPGHDTVCGLGNRKDERYREQLEEGAVDVVESSVLLVRRLRSDGVPTGAVTSNRDGRTVLEAAGIADLFDAVVDGSALEEDASLTGTPAPDLFLEAARRLDAKPGRSVLVEDTAAGVEAGRRGEFRIVVGLAREGEGEDLEAAGADMVVSDLGRVPISSGLGRQASRDPG